MHDTQFNNLKVFFILVLAINKRVVKVKTGFLVVISIFLNNSQFFDNYNIWFN